MHAEAALGEFGGDNRAGVEGTLHRISAIRNRKGAVVGLTCRVGRAVTGHIDMIRDILDIPNSVLFLGRPGVVSSWHASEQCVCAVCLRAHAFTSPHTLARPPETRTPPPNPVVQGKTTVIREMARVLSDELHKRVVIVDTSNEVRVTLVVRARGWAWREGGGPCALPPTRPHTRAHADWRRRRRSPPRHWRRAAYAGARPLAAAPHHGEQCVRVCVCVLCWTWARASWLADRAPSPPRQGPRTPSLPSDSRARSLTHPHTHSSNLIQIEAVENHMPEVVIVDEIGTEAEALACRTIGA